MADRLVGTITREQLQVAIKPFTEDIDNRIKITHNSGGSKISFELPHNYVMFQGISSEDAEIMIVSELLLIYSSAMPQGRGFKKVYLTKKPDCLCIEWDRGIDKKEKERRMKIIASKTRNDGAHVQARGETSPRDSARDA